MSPISRKDSLILTAILIAGLLLRLYHLDTFSIFFDEKSTMVVSQGMVLDGSDQKEIYLAPTFTPKQFWAPKSLPDYYNAMARSDIGNSSFYYLLLHLWMDVFGLSDFSARLFSVVFSVLIIAATYFFGRRFFSSNIGLIAAAIVAIEPFFIAYSHQARNYCLTFFLTLLATDFFLQIIENRSNSRKTLLLYLGYIVTASLGLFSHFLTISVLLAHGIYALFFLRRIDGWIKLGIAGILSLSGMAWWMLFAGGKWTMSNLKEQADLYRSVAEHQATNAFGLILPATFKNVFFKSLPLFSDLVIFTNGLSDALEGKKNVVLAISVGIILIVWYRFRNKIKLPEPLNQAVPYVFLLLPFLFYSNHKFQFSILSVSIFALSFLYDVHSKANEVQRKRLWLLYIISLVPSLFLILMSFKNGHTYGIMQRYSGFSFPYVIILISLLLQYFTSLPGTVRTLIFLFMTIQLYFVGQRLNEFYQDKSVKYGYFGEPRPSNPFYAAAKKLIKIYQPGDTIVYPSKPNIILTENDRNFSNYRMRDAQLTNLYLPKDASYIQRVDTLERDRILIKRKGQILEIINLKGLRAGDD
jgi:uncharacterized membrane protein